MINFIKRNLYNYLKPKFIDNFSTMIYSQEGEDMILSRLLGQKHKGFYIDIGAHHPRRFSNTYLFYKKGWKGINIDPNADAIKLFQKERPNDINLCLPISDKKQLLTYYMFNEPALNTFVKSLAEKHTRGSNYTITDTLELESQTLGQVLDNFLPKNTAIDFMSIDVEGLDLNVLKSNNWTKYCPEIILIEFLNFNLIDFFKSELYNFLNNLDYEFIAKTHNTIFFKKN